MVNYMDTALGQIVTKLKSKGMWENTLMVVTSDNGGPTYWLPPPAETYGGADNNPLKGGKLSDWEEGIRVNAFVTGGAVPAAKRGSKLEDLIHVADWYATFCAIAGVDLTDQRAAKAKLPPVDGIDHSRLILGDAPAGAGNRTEIHHSVRALASGKWKLVTGGLMDGGFASIILNKASNPMGVPIIPMSSYARGWGHEAIEGSLFAMKNCGHGCLYDVFEDPEERFDTYKEHPQVHSELMARLAELNKGVFLPDVGKSTTDACNKWDGYYGPFIDVPVSHFLQPEEQVFV
jgi:arylsulfatase I/J